MTAAVGAALRIATEQDVEVSAEQLRAVLRDTARCLRRLQDDAAWRTVAVASGNVAAYRGGYVQAIELIEQSAEQGVATPSAATERCPWHPGSCDGTDHEDHDPTRPLGHRAGHSIRDRLPGDEGLTGDEQLTVSADAARWGPGGDT